MRDYDYVPREHRFIHSDGRFTNVFEDPAISPQDGIGLSEEWYKHADYMMEHRNYYDFSDIDPEQLELMKQQQQQMQQQMMQQRQQRQQQRRYRRPPQNLQNRQQQRQHQQSEQEKQKIMDDLTSKAATQQGASFSHDKYNNFGNFRIMGLSNDGDDFMRMMQPHLHFTAGGDEPVVESKSQSHGNTEFHHDMEEMKEILKNSTEQSEYKPLTEEEVTALMQESRNVEKDDIHRQVYGSDKAADNFNKFEEEMNAQSQSRDGNRDDKFKTNKTLAREKEKKDVKQ